jgi:hypothetical protein
VDTCFPFSPVTAYKDPNQQFVNCTWFKTLVASRLGFLRGITALCCLDLRVGISLPCHTVLARGCRGVYEGTCYATRSDTRDEGTLPATTPTSTYPSLRAR